MKAIIILFSVVAVISIWQLTRHYPDFFKIKKLKRLLVVIGLITGAGLVLYAFKFWFGQSRYFESAITISILLLGLPITIYFGRDFLRGLQLKISGNLAVGKSIKTDKLDGQVLHTGLFSVRLSDSSGRQLSLPYSSLAFIPETPSEDLQNGVKDENLTVLSLETPHSDIRKLQHKIRQIVFNCPWVRLGEAPHIQIEPGDNDTYQVTIVVGLLANKYKSRFEDLMRERLLSG